MNLSELICVDTSLWTDEDDNVGEASKACLSAPTVARNYDSADEKEKERLEYFSEILQYR